MRIAVTGGTGFLGRYLVHQLSAEGHSLRCWRRQGADLGGFGAAESHIQWMPGELDDDEASARLVAGCQAVVHSALYHPGSGFIGGEGDVIAFVQKNVIGTLKLIEAALAAGAGRFVFISTCAVHDRILSDRRLDETHPLWAQSHYGAHKAAIEKFVHSYGYGQGFPICALRPTGIYGTARPASQSKWFELVKQVVAGRRVECTRGGKEVHAADVARAASLLLRAPASAVTGEAFNCYDRYISQWDVAHLARKISGSDSDITGRQTEPKNQIETGKLRELGMHFGGEPLLRQTMEELVAAARDALK